MNYSITRVLIVSPEGSVIAVPSLINADINDTVVFECVSRGGPNNNVTWVELDSGTTVASSPFLTISPVMAESVGDYECSVSNTAGADTATASLLGKNIFFSKWLI